MRTEMYYLQFDTNKERSRRMKRFLLLIGLAILMPLTVLALGAKTEPDESVEAELKSLKSQVEFLETRVQTLETQMADKTLKDLPFTIPQRPQVPKGWRKRQFNGIPYYVIPLQQNSKK
jgi:cell division protein FtsB